MQQYAGELVSGKAKYLEVLSRAELLEADKDVLLKEVDMLKNELDARESELAKIAMVIRD